MPCETQHVYTCHNQRQLRHVRLNIKHHHYRLQHLNETSYKVLKRMDQQCSAIVKHWTMSNVQNVHLWL